MNITEYISSGIVESYVLGLASAEERAEFERMCAAHDEVRNAREAFELSLERYAMRDAIQPSKNIKSKIFAEIEIEGDKLRETAVKSEPYSTDAAEGQVQTPGRVVRLGVWRFIAAASIVLLIGSTILNFYFFNQYREYTVRYDQLLAQQSDLAKNNEAMQARLNMYENTVAMLKDPNMVMIKMPGKNVPTSPDTNSLATVYWHAVSKDVFLLVNNLPQSTTDKQYQLWAIVDGKPVDAGVFDVNQNGGVIKMKNIPSAQAFAVTLEKRGGSPTPTMEAMYVMGKV